MFKKRYGSLFLKTTRLETHSNDSFGVATGFFFTFSRMGHNSSYIVTNKHVVANKEEVVAHFLEGTENMPNLGQIIKYNIKNPDQEFILHKDYDLAILPMEKINQHMSENKLEISHSYIRTITIADSRRFSIEDVYFIGYPDGLWDSHNYLPLLRKGSTATLMDINYADKEMFLIDANTIPGSSGSPVFIKNVEYEYDQDFESIELYERFRFAGILSSTFKQRPKIGTVEVPIPLSKEKDDFRSYINIGVVIKPMVLHNFIKSYLETHGLLEDWFKREQ